jgi:serine/threonine protein kinase
MTPDEARMVGPWSLGDQLGSGGNATVWQATRPEVGEPVALKVIAATKAGKEPYRRFIREIEFLRSLGDTRGVLPLLDAYLPDKPSKDDRPWLAMPVATPIADALVDADLETVVEALAQIAETLARLASADVAHRDIKPGNLYELDGEWLVGDFGLIAVPDMDALTRAGKALGPAHYTAYEMILDPTAADPLPADVYSLGKTLWVLATGQGFPPEGHQPAGTRKHSIADLRPHPHGPALDQLVDRTTRLHPEERPSMSEVARDLRAWSQLRGEPGALDVANQARRLRERLAEELASEDILDQRKEMALDAVRKLHDLFKPLNDALRNVHPRAEIHQRHQGAPRSSSRSCG